MWLTGGVDGCAKYIVFAVKLNEKIRADKLRSGEARVQIQVETVSRPRPGPPPGRPRPGVGMQSVCNYIPIIVAICVCVAYKCEIRARLLVKFEQCHMQTEQRQPM